MSSGAKIINGTPQRNKAVNLQESKTTHRGSEQSVKIQQKKEHLAAAFYHLKQTSKSINQRVALVPGHAQFNLQPRTSGLN